MDMKEKIKSKEQIIELWENTHNTNGKPDWSHILPYYDDNIIFRDSIQEIRGIKDFSEMTARLAGRSKKLEMKIINIIMDDRLILIEWEMTLSFKRYPNSVLHGATRLKLNDTGKISEQRDYYDLWGDIFDNIPFLAKGYRRFMKKKFG